MKNAKKYKEEQCQEKSLYKTFRPCIFNRHYTFLARGWFNSGFPKGHDLMAGPIFAWIIHASATKYGFLFPSWDPYCYLGHPLFITSPFPIYYLLFFLFWLFGDPIIAVKIYPYR
jgi:hypothetical protein